MSRRPNQRRVRMFQSPRNRVNTSNMEWGEWTEGLESTFQSPRNRVNTSNTSYSPFTVGESSGFNPLEIGSTLQMNACKAHDKVEQSYKFQSPRNRVNTSNRLPLWARGSPLIPRFQSPRNRVNTSNSSCALGHRPGRSTFQSPRNRVNTSNSSRS